MINKLNIKQAKEGLKKKDFSSVELTRACLEAIKETDEKLNVFVILLENFQYLIFQITNNCFL